MHNHILSEIQGSVTAKFKSLEDWHSSSRAALETVTQMVVDIADSHDTITARVIESLPPIYLYIARAALRNLHGHTAWKHDPDLRAAEERLRTSLELRSRRWGSWESEISF